MTGLERNINDCIFYQNQIHKPLFPVKKNAFNVKKFNTNGYYSSASTDNTDELMI